MSRFAMAKRSESVVVEYAGLRINALRLILVNNFFKTNTKVFGCKFFGSR